MSKLLGEYKDDYEVIVNDDKNETGMSKIYSAYNKKTHTECCLKIISKEKLKIQNYDYLLERLQKEQDLQTLCNSKNTVNFYRRLETEDNIIFELEYCEDNLNNYLQENGELSRDKKLFKEIVISIAKALKTLNENGIMHRDIKPQNIFIKNANDENNRIIKLGDFGCAIKISENDYDSIGTVLYNAPEIVQDLEYDEKVDLWSLGITLFELYFGVIPYGYDANINAMKNAIYDEKKFIFPKTFKKDEKPKIPSLDILFKRLLTINPEDRMTYKEFFDYVFSDNFMKEGVICVNNNPKYQKVFNDILNEEFIKFVPPITQEADDPVKKQEENAHKINVLVKGGNFPDIMNFSNAEANYDNKFNNIIYYDINVNYLSSINKDSDYFERVTPGAFILCTNMDSFKLIRTEILIEIQKDKRMSFNLITTGSQCDNVMQFLNEDQKFKNCIKNVCVYCMNIQKWGPLKNKYDLVYDVVTSQEGVKNFIKNFSSEEIKPYHLKKLITLNDYLDKYKDRHIKISQFYGDLTPQTYKENIEKMKSLINKENKEKKLYKDQNVLLQGFLTFDINKDLELLDKLIIKEYTKETFYSDLNKWLMNSKFNSYEVVAYFTARLMYSLNNFGKNGKTYYIINKNELRRGLKMPYSSLLPYERAKGKVILLSSFTSTTEEAQIAEKFSGRKNTQTLYKTKKRFSVILIINNFYKKDWVPNGVNIQKLSVYDEKEILYQPFSFYFVRDVQIDQQNYKADIYLETIGKKEILEEKIKIGKEIKYNEKEKIMQVI